MDDPESVDGVKRAKGIRSYSAEAASGASHGKGHTLLPMLIGGLVLIVLGMLIVAFIV
jgi:hypothetical protein